MRHRILIICALLVLTERGAARQTAPPPIELFIQAGALDDRVARRALDQIAGAWTNSYTAMFIDMARLMRRAPRPTETDLEQPSFDADVDNMNIGTAGRDLFPQRSASRESLVRARLVRFLEKQTGKRFDDSLNGWREWMWTLPYDPHPRYGEFKGIVYGQIDERMRRFFPPGVQSRIRLDEIDWGGVRVNGIPPLVYPRVLAANQATYLRDSHIVFGVAINGEARAYPKRILAWHEMATDRIGGVELTVVYCTLCGTVIPYESTVADRLLRFGTSGLLYRSNKLMFDEETASLWNTTEGTPVVGPLADSRLELTPREVVTTTWGEWRTMHPDTTVLSLDTGHKRDYGEGVAYREYFATDDLYFRVSKVDRRLKNKTEVLTLRVRPRRGGPPQPVAIAAPFLQRNRVFHFEIEGRRLVVITSARGANRVYDLGDRPVALQSIESDAFVRDGDGGRWRVTEEALVTENGTAVRFARVAAARAFWFGWYAQYPDTQLIK